MIGVFKMGKKIRYKIGDVFLIPLENELKGAGRVLNISKSTILIELYQMKPIKDVDEFNFEQAVKEKPVSIGWCYDDPLKNGDWHIIDNRAIEGEIEMPFFWTQDVGDMNYYIRKGTKDSYRTAGERIEISKEDISKYDPYGIGNEISERERYIKRLREAGLI